MNELTFRKARREDLPEIVQMLADDFLGRRRERDETPLPESYFKAFEEIERDANNELIVVESGDGEIVGTFQMTFMPSISFQGSRRANIESIRVDRNLRGQGVGKQIFEWAIKRAREKNCLMIQLTTNNERADARRFYESLGFKSSHVGMKMYLNTIVEAEK